MDLEKFKTGGEWNKAGKPKIGQKLVDEGTKIEYEHTSDKETAARIAKDHITEKGPGYYPALKKMEAELSKKAAHAHGFSDSIAIADKVTPDPEQGRLRFIYGLNSEAIASARKDAGDIRRNSSRVLALAGGKSPIVIAERALAREFINSAKHEITKESYYHGFIEEIRAISSRNS